MDETVVDAVESAEKLVAGEQDRHSQNAVVDVVAAAPIAAQSSSGLSIMAPPIAPAIQQIKEEEASNTNSLNVQVQEQQVQTQPDTQSTTTTTKTADVDASLMPPPPVFASTSNANTISSPGGQTSISGPSRSSGRSIKPTMKVRGDSEEPLSHRSHSGSFSTSAGQNHGFRNRKSTTTQSTSSSGGGNRALRLKLNLKGGHASRGKGDPTLAGVKKTKPYMQGYNRELDSSDDETGEGMAFEEQLILRMPENTEATKMLSEWVKRREVGNDGREVELKFKDSRRALFKMGDKQFSSKLVDLPAIVESHKTLDNKQLFKIADISQMLLVTHQIKDESEVTRADGLNKVEGLTDDYIYDHGITPPMRWARKRRFRKRIHKRTIETVEKEVERLLAEDERAEKVEFTMIDLAEADLSDSEEDDGGEGGRQGRPLKREDGRDSPTASIAPSGAADEMSEMGEDDEQFSQIGEEGEMSIQADGEDNDVDLDLERELEQEMLLQQQEDEDEEDDEASTMSDRKGTRGRSQSRATSDDDDEEEDDDDDDEEDDLFDAGMEEEEGTDNKKAENDEGAIDEDDDDDLDEEEQERRVRETQLEAECKEIEAMVKRKNVELQGTNNALIKQRNTQTLKRMQIELDNKKAQLVDLKQQRREVKEAAKAEAQLQAEAQSQAERASVIAASATPRSSSSATPSINQPNGSAAPLMDANKQDSTGKNAVAITNVEKTIQSIKQSKATTASVAGGDDSINVDSTIDETTQDVNNDDDDDEDQGRQGHDSDQSDLFE